MLLSTMADLAPRTYEVRGFVMAHAVLGSIGRIGTHTAQPNFVIAGCCFGGPLAIAADLTRCCQVAGDDFAGIAVFLAAPASDFVTGAAIAVDGGYSSLA